MQLIDRIIQKSRSWSGFDNSSLITQGEIILISFVEGVVTDTPFEVVAADISYNIILGRSWIYDMGAIPSTLHQVKKFPFKWGIRQIKDIKGRPEK